MLCVFTLVLDQTCQGFVYVVVKQWIFVLFINPTNFSYFITFCLISWLFSFTSLGLLYYLSYSLSTSLVYFQSFLLHCFSYPPLLSISVLSGTDPLLIQSRHIEVSLKSAELRMDRTCTAGDHGFAVTLGGGLPENDGNPDETEIDDIRWAPGSSPVWSLPWIL